MQIELCENRQRLLYAINRKLANKIYDMLNPFFDDYDSLFFREHFLRSSGIVEICSPKIPPQRLRHYPVQWNDPGH